LCFVFSSRRRHTRSKRDWSSDVCSSDLRRSAMAAPRATARLLAWLPLAGLGLGVLLGVDPLVVFADGGLGTASLLLGLLLMLLGRRWSALLVGRAQRAGS